MNSVRIEDDRVVKRYTTWGSVASFNHDLLARCGYDGAITYSPKRERFKRETQRLAAYANGNLPVPELIKADEETLEIVMRRLPGTSFIKLLIDGRLKKREALACLEKSSEVMRAIHEIGGKGDTYLCNFLVDGGNVAAIDFEHETAGGNEGEMENLYLSALIEVPAPREEVRSAVTYGYGAEPRDPPEWILKGMKFLHPAISVAFRLEQRLL